MHKQEFLHWASAVISCLLVYTGIATAGQDYTVRIDPDTNVSASGPGNYSGDETKMTDGSGMNGNPDNGPVSWPEGAGLPPTWTATSSSYPAEWQCVGTGSGLLSGAANGKIGWVTFDLSESVMLADLYFWNCRSNPTAGFNGINIYFSDNALNIPSPSKVDYSFSSANGWTQYDDDDANPTTPRFTVPQYSSGGAYQFTLDVSGIKARFVGIEVLTNYGNASRIGLAEFAATATPPPAGTVIVVK